MTLSTDYRLLKATAHRHEFQNPQGRTFIGKKIIIQSYFPYQREHIWAKIQYTSSLQYICRPWLSFRPRAGHALPAKWQAGDTAKLSLTAYGIFPLGKHDIHLELIDAERYTIQSRERGRIVSIWDHLITLEAAGTGTIYTDEVVVYAGRLSGFVAWWATHLYRHRQRRWQRLLKQTQA
jgi:hypothetical protein